MKAILKSFAALSLIALAACSSNSGNGVLGGPGGNGPANSNDPATQKAVQLLSSHPWCLVLQDPQSDALLQERYIFAASGGLDVNVFQVVNQRRGPSVGTAQGTYALNGSTMTTTINGKQTQADLSYEAQDQQTGQERVIAATPQGNQAWDPCN